MPVLTKQTLNPDNLGYYVDWKTLSRGQQYHRENRVLITYFDGASATCRVRGELGSYSVSIHSEPSRKVSLSCTCPQAEKVRYCKHMVAAMLTLRDYIESNAENQWQYRLSLAIENSPRKGASHTPRTRYILLFGLSREKYPNGDYSFRLLPYRIRMQ